MPFRSFAFVCFAFVHVLFLGRQSETLILQNISQLQGVISIAANENHKHGQYSGTQPKIQFSVSKRGGQLLWLDGLKYFRNNENRTNLFWRCHWYYRRIRCPVLICMNKYDATDFRQIHKHCHVKSGKKQATATGGAQRKAIPVTTTTLLTTAALTTATSIVHPANVSGLHETHITLSIHSDEEEDEGEVIEDIEETSQAVTSTAATTHEQHHNETEMFSI